MMFYYRDALMLLVARVCMPFTVSSSFCNVVVLLHCLIRGSASLLMIIFSAKMTLMLPCLCSSQEGCSVMLHQVLSVKVIIILTAISSIIRNAWRKCHPRCMACGASISNKYRIANIIVVMNETLDGSCVIRRIFGDTSFLTNDNCTRILAERPSYAYAQAHYFCWSVSLRKWDYTTAVVCTINYLLIMIILECCEICTDTHYLLTATDYWYKFNLHRIYILKCKFQIYIMRIILCLL